MRNKILLFISLATLTGCVPMTGEPMSLAEQQRATTFLLQASNITSVATQKYLYTKSPDSECGEAMSVAEAADIAKAVTTLVDSALQGTVTGAHCPLAEDAPADGGL